MSLENHPWSFVLAKIIWDDGLELDTLDGELLLETEEQAWELLQKLVRDELKVQSVPKIVAGDWAKIDVYIPAERYDSAITPYMMQGWLELQRSVYRSYSLATGRDGEGRSLSDREKDALELVVEVRSGSSDQAVDMTAVLEKLVTAMAEKMEPQHVVIVAIVALLTWGGTSMFKTWLAEKKETKLAELEVVKTKSVTDAHTQALKTISDIVSSDLARKQLIETAALQVPIVSDLGIEAAKGRDALVKHVTKEDARVNGVFVTAAAGQSITSRTRLASEDVRADGLYKIRKVDTTVATGFRVHLVGKDGRELVGDVAEVMTTLEDREIIRAAEWEKTPVFLQINAKQRRNELTDARILRARKYDPDTDGHWH